MDADVALRRVRRCSRRRRRQDSMRAWAFISDLRSSVTSHRWWSGSTAVAPAEGGIGTPGCSAFPARVQAGRAGTRAPVRCLPASRAMADHVGHQTIRAVHPNCCAVIESNVSPRTWRTWSGCRGSLRGRGEPPNYRYGLVVPRPAPSRSPYEQAAAEVGGQRPERQCRSRGFRARPSIQRRMVPAKGAGSRRRRKARGSPAVLTASSNRVAMQKDGRRRRVNDRECAAGERWKLPMDARWYHARAAEWRIAVQQFREAFPSLCLGLWTLV